MIDHRLFSLVSLPILLLFTAQTCSNLAIDSRSASKKFTNNLGQQTIETILVSIEERLRYLDRVYSMQYSATIEGKLDRFLNKLDHIEMRIERLEVKLAAEVEKVALNISNKSFKDELTKEHIMRRLDHVYDRLYHKLIYMELKFDMDDKKNEDKLNVILKELRKNNENIITGLMDTETEIGDVITTMDDIRASQVSFEDHLKNITAATKNLEIDANMKYYKLHTALQDVNATYSLKNEENVNNFEAAFQIFGEKLENFEDALNNYFNKMSNANEEMWDWSESMEELLKSTSATLNDTRTEQQNGLRALTVELGRMSSRKSQLSDAASDEKLKSISVKIDENFENLLATQNMFLESCYRVQMDESQLESKISLILQKLIDTFERKTTCEPKNFQAIEQILKSHDSSVKRNLYNVTNKTNSLLSNNEQHFRLLSSNLKTLQNKTQNMYRMIENQNASNFLTHVYGALRGFKGDLTLLTKELDVHYNATEKNNKQFERSLNEIKTILANNTEVGLKNEAELLEKVKNVQEKITSLEKTSRTKNRTVVSSSTEQIPEDLFESQTETESAQSLNEYILSIFGNGSEVTPRNSNITEPCLDIDVRFGTNSSEDCLSKYKIPNNDNKSEI